MILKLVVNFWAWWYMRNYFFGISDTGGSEEKIRVEGRVFRVQKLGAMAHFLAGAGHTINYVSNTGLNEWGKVKRPTSHVTRQANVKRQKL